MGWTWVMYNYTFMKVEQGGYSEKLSFLLGDYSIIAFLWRITSWKVQRWIQLIMCFFSMVAMKLCNIFLWFIVFLFFLDKVWIAMLEWFGVLSALQQNIFCHAQQFCGLYLFNKAYREKLHTLWLVCIWKIWKDCNNWVFNQNGCCFEHLVDQIKVHSWWWYKAKNNSFAYEIAPWWTNPSMCLDLCNSLWTLKVLLRHHTLIYFFFFCSFKLVLYRNLFNSKLIVFWLFWHVLCWNRWF